MSKASPQSRTPSKRIWKVPAPKTAEQAGFVLPEGVDLASLRYEVAFLQFEKGRAFAACARGLQSAILPNGGAFVRGMVLATGLTRAEADEMVERLTKDANGAGSVDE